MRRLLQVLVTILYLPIFLPALLIIIVVDYIGDIFPKTKFLHSIEQYLYVGMVYAGFFIDGITRRRVVSSDDGINISEGKKIHTIPWQDIGKVTTYFDGFATGLKIVLKNGECVHLASQDSAFEIREDLVRYGILIDNGT